MMNSRVRSDRKAERVAKFSQALVIIGPMSATWGAGLTVAITTLFLYPYLPDGRQWEMLVMLWAIITPVMTIASFVAIMMLFRLMLWAVTEPKESRPRSSNGRFAPIAHRGKNKQYLVVVDENGKE